MMKGWKVFFFQNCSRRELTQIGDTTIIPLVDVTFGVREPAHRQKITRTVAVAVCQVKMTPSAVLVIKNGQIKLVNIKNQDTMTKVLDMIPDLVDRFTYTEGRHAKR